MGERNRPTMKYFILLAFLLMPFRIVIADDSVLNPIKALTPQQMIEREFSKQPVMIRIARAESNFCKYKINSTSSARGCFQILKGTWAYYKCEGDVMDDYDNIACARIIYDINGTVDWLASKDNW